MRRLLICCFGAMLGSSVAQSVAQPVDGDVPIEQRLYRKVFGEKAILDPAMVARVKAARPGKRHYLDTDNDGRPEEVWFIDTAGRHGPVGGEDPRPILVRAFDEDGDLVEGGEADRDSDLYLADWKADGTIDVALDYIDHDGDQDLDEMNAFFMSPGRGGTPAGLRTWWSRDDGDDNLLWYDVNYRYYQRPSQVATHFNGDESFSAFILHEDSEAWTPMWENPFLFYDHDGDGAAEEVVRVSGTGENVRTLRWSFDADHSSTVDNDRDYDVSMSAFAAGWDGENQNDFVSRLNVPPSVGETLTIRGIPTRPIVERHAAPGFFRPVIWGRVLMTWVENDHNVGYRSRGENAFERWEGVISQASDDPRSPFGAIGGPAVGPYNTRNEIVIDPQTPSRYYFNPASLRVHLLHSDRAWIDVDYNLDDESDMLYEFVDTGGDGRVDRIEVDVDGDGQMEDHFRIDTSNIVPVEWSWEDLVAHWRPVLDQAPAELYELNLALIDALATVEGGGSTPDAVWTLVHSRFEGEDFPEEFHDKFIDSDAAMLYYLQLVRDRLIWRLKQADAVDRGFLRRVDELRGSGATSELAAAVRAEFDLHVPQRDYAQAMQTLRAELGRKRVAWTNAWRPPGWGWESEKIAFRTYSGKFGFFGKTRDVLIYPNIIRQRTTGQGNYEAEKESHAEKDGRTEKDGHTEEERGIDALHVGRSGGIGGVILYVGGKAYPAYDTGQTTLTYENELIEETDDRITFEIRINGVGPEEAPYTVRLRPTVIAGESYSPIEVVVEGGRPGDQLELGLGLTRLAVENFLVNTASGAMGVWGCQEPGVGWIGTGVIWPAHRYRRIEDTELEHRVVLDYETGEPLTYYITGDWLNGRKYPVQPSPMDWLEQLTAMAGRIRTGNAPAR